MKNLTERYGQDLIELQLNESGGVKEQIALTLSSAFGAGHPGGYKPKMYLHKDKLVKVVNNNIEEYCTKSIEKKEGYLIVTTDSAQYISIKKSND